MISHHVMYDMTMVICLFFFFNQQFITQGTKVDHGSYIETTYMTTETTWRKEKEREEREEMRKRGKRN